MEKRIDAWVDKKTVISVALGMLLAVWIAWFGAFILRGLGVGYGMGYGMGGRGSMMQRGDVEGMRDHMQRMRDTSGAAGTYEAGIDIPAGIDPSAL